ncbi:yae1 domain-containing protein 1 [Alligator mississippiensis]|uniref:Yae1 domain-containing protein 1 n=1 Tax=Alligator mississippiensis TaxID=8496 RepID=A0A151P2P8_ALLMI|nr:yae1 domain-containing protein 1 [Alligator mississippiensis]
METYKRMSNLSFQKLYKSNCFTHHSRCTISGNREHFVQRSWRRGAPATMSWVQAAVSRPREDVFDEDADEMHLVQKEWKSTMEKRIKVLDTGTPPAVLVALLSWCHLNRHDSALLSKINDLLDAVGKYEEHVLKCLNSVHPQPHLGELLDSVQDMDLSCTIPAEEEFNGTKSERPCGSGATFSESCCRSNACGESGEEIRTLSSPEAHQNWR